MTIQVEAGERAGHTSIMGRKEAGKTSPLEGF